jgi:hypothetical protein
VATDDPVDLAAAIAELAGAMLAGARLAGPAAARAAAALRAVAGWPFTDPVTGERCTLLVRSGRPWVVHAGCPALADVVPVLDAFYCPSCGWSGRVSGAWAAELAGWR